MARVVGGPKQGTFVHSIGAHRKALIAEPGLGVDGPPRPSEAKARPLVAAGLTGKLVDAHWPHLGGAVGAAAKISEAGTKLVGNAARVYGRAFESAQKIVAAQLSMLPEAERSEAATRTFSALARLVGEVGESTLPAALAAASGLIDTMLRMKTRGTLTLTHEDLKRAGEDAVAAVLSLLERVHDRRGQSSMLNVLPRFVEELELGRARLNAKQSLEITLLVAGAIAGGTPKSGTDFAELSTLSALVSKHAKGAGQKRPAEILERAFDEYAASKKQAIDVVRGGLEGAPIDLALGQLLDANPTATASLLTAVEQLITAQRQNAGHPEALSHAAAIVARFAGSAVGETVVSSLALHLGGLATPNAGPHLAAAARAKTAPAVAGDLVRAVLLGAGRALDAYEPVLLRIHELSDANAVRVASVFTGAIALGREDPYLLEALIERAKEGRDEDPLGGLEQLASAYHAVAQELVRYPALQGDAKIVAAIVAGATTDHQDVPRLVSGLSTLKQYLPKAPLAKLVAEDADGHPGLAALVRAKDFAEDPLQLLATFLEDAREAGIGQDQEAIARAAIRLAVQTSGIRNAQAVHLPRIRQDWRQAVANPDALNYAARGKAIDARAPRTLAGFLKAHPEIPIDFALTAGCHLSPAQLSWVIDRLGGKVGLDATRLQRDAIFCLTGLNRLDVVDALAQSKSPPKAIGAVLKELASRFQRNDLGAVPLDEIVLGLNAGEDPIASLREREVKAAFQGLDLYALAEGDVTQEGLDEILAMKENVADLVVQYSPGFQVWDYDKDIDMTRLLAPFLDAVKDTLQGTWPRRKYEDAVGLRQLSILTAEQRVIWRRNMVVMAQDGEAPAAVVDPTVVPLSMGLAKAIERDVRIEHPEIEGLASNVASRDRLLAMRSELLEKLRNSAKGSDEHRAASKKIGPILDRLRVIDLKLALDALAGVQDPATIAGALRGVAEQAIGSLRRLGARGCAEVAEKIVAAMPRALAPKERALAGAYAIDEDSLTAMINSHKSGCLSYGDKRRRWGMCGSLTDANTKMLHTFQDGAQKYRTFLRLLPVKLAGYQGPALFIESPVGDTGGNQADLALLRKALFDKGRAMGVPVLGADANPPAGWTTQNVEVTLTFDWGHTGVYHSDRLSDSKAQGNGGLAVDKTHQLHVSIPPELAARMPK